MYIARLYELIRNNDIIRSDKLNISLNRAKHKYK